MGNGTRPFLATITWFFLSRSAVSAFNAESSASKSDNRSVFSDNCVRKLAFWLSTSRNFAVTAAISALDMSLIDVATLPKNALP